MEIMIKRCTKSKNAITIPMGFIDRSCVQILGLFPGMAVQEWAALPMRKTSFQANIMTVCNQLTNDARELGDIIIISQSTSDQTHEM